jgi:hypothetical protein
MIEAQLENDRCQNDRLQPYDERTESGQDGHGCSSSFL